MGGSFGSVTRQPAITIWRSAPSFQPLGRDWLRKGFEAWFTALIELAWGKRRIMEVYLNVAEWGPGVYGAETAARHYFHQPADALNSEEAVRLAAALPDPLDWSPRRPGRRLIARGAAIRANMQGVPTAMLAVSQLCTMRSKRSGSFSA